MLEIGTKFVGKNTGDSFTEYTIKKCVDTVKEKYIFEVKDITVHLGWNARDMAHVIDTTVSNTYELTGKFITSEYFEYIKVGREARREVYNNTKTTEENIKYYTKQFIDDYNWFMLR